VQDKPNNREQLFDEFLEFEKSKNAEKEKSNKDFQFSTMQLNWINLLAMLIMSFVFEYITNNYEYFNSYSLFSYLYQCTVIGVIIVRLIDEFAFKEIDTFANWNESPIAKSIYISAVTLSIAIIILATSGTVIFKPNTKETESSNQSNQTQVIEKHYYGNETSAKSRLDTIKFSTSTKEN
jgi:hypothetical protein